MELEPIGQDTPSPRLSAARLTPASSSNCAQPLPSSPMLTADQGKISLHCYSGLLLRRVRIGNSPPAISGQKSPGFGGARSLISYVSSDSMPSSGKLDIRDFRFSLNSLQ